MAVVRLRGWGRYLIFYYNHIYYKISLQKLDKDYAYKELVMMHIGLVGF